MVEGVKRQRGVWDYSCRFSVMEEYCGERRVGGGGRTEECASFLLQMSGGCASGGGLHLFCSQRY